MIREIEREEGVFPSDDEWEIVLIGGGRIIAAVETHHHVGHHVHQGREGRSPRADKRVAEDEAAAVLGRGMQKRHSILRWVRWGEDIPFPEEFSIPRPVLSLRLLLLLLLLLLVARTPPLALSGHSKSHADDEEGRNEGICPLRASCEKRDPFGKTCPPLSGPPFCAALAVVVVAVVVVVVVGPLFPLARLYSER